MYVHMLFAYMCVHLYICLCMHLFMYVCVCMYVHMCVHVHICWVGHNQERERKRRSKRKTAYILEELLTK